MWACDAFSSCSSIYTFKLGMCGMYCVIRRVADYRFPNYNMCGLRYGLS